MTKETPKITDKKRSEKQEREDRLAQALRANLRRRKTQSRARKSDSNQTDEKA